MSQNLLLKDKQILKHRITRLIFFCVTATKVKVDAMDSMFVIIKNFQIKGREKKLSREEESMIFFYSHLSIYVDTTVFVL